jgi:hypothetical protein
VSTVARATPAHRPDRTDRLPTFVVRSRSSSVTGPARWVRVRVHPDPHHLIAAALRRSPWERAREWDGCLGCFQPAPARDHWDPDTATWVRRWPAGYAGILRLVSGHVRVEIVAHELVHAAAQIYRMNIARHLRLGNTCGPREEAFAHIYGQLAADFDRTRPPGME